ncbi:hypothetical protein [Sinorhizobium meliloti]|uniref:hypothetical protein n=1 Tax=Rhizobium meliloti TaxID=382 RepID=UPI000FD934FA|nr:hypothetical protein [Sinorhizobium meliloti]RVG23661.1 hypothetical protein CN229_27300 [Sinorhizobium meliloti]
MSPLKYSQTKFVTRHNGLNTRLQAFLSTKRGRSIGTDKLKNDLALASASSLKAINCAARIRFAEVFGKDLRVLLGRNNVDDVFFVTLSLHEHAVPFDKSASFNVVACKDATHTLLEGLSFIGIVEAAYYYSAPFMPGARHPFVSWHSHAIVWGTRQSELAKRRRLFNQKHRPFVPGRYAAHYRRITPTIALSYARYMSKSLVNEYTAYPKKREVADPDTGEIIKQLTGKWRNRKRPIRPTNLIRAMQGMDRRTLKQLCFAGGAGKAFRRNLLAVTRKSLHADAVARASQQRRLLFGP